MDRSHVKRWHAAAGALGRPGAGWLPQSRCALLNRDEFRFAFVAWQQPSTSSPTPKELVRQCVEALTLLLSSAVPRVRSLEERANSVDQLKESTKKPKGGRIK